MEDDRSGGPWEIQRQGCQSPKLFEEGDASLESLGAEREGSDLRPEVPQKTFHSRGKEPSLLIQAGGKAMCPWSQTELASAQDEPSRAAARKASPAKAPSKVQGPGPAALTEGQLS